MQLPTPPPAPPKPLLFTEPTASRADELLASFGPEGHGDPAVLAAATGLRALADLDLTPPPAAPPLARAPPSPAPRPAPTPPSAARPRPRKTTWTISRPPRAAAPTASRWPLAVFALGLLVLFAAWLYRPTSPATSSRPPLPLLPPARRHRRRPCITALCTATDASSLRAPGFAAQPGRRLQHTRATPPPRLPPPPRLTSSHRSPSPPFVPG
ncbi:MAG: hypothetical protein R3B70_11550 [Polyangiaceae bacterium]